MVKGDYVYWVNRKDVPGVKDEDLDVLRVKEVFPDGVVLDLGVLSTGEVIPTEDLKLVFIRDVMAWRIIFIDSDKGFLTTENKKYYFIVEDEKVYLQDRDDISIPKALHDRITALGKKIASGKIKYVLMHDKNGYWNEDTGWQVSIVKATKSDDRSIEYPEEINGAIRWIIY